MFRSVRAGPSPLVGGGLTEAIMTQLDISPTWNSQTKPQQRRGWDRFTQALDRGDAGYHRFYRVLMPLWEGGERP